MEKDIKKGINKLFRVKEYKEVIEFLKKSEDGQKEEDRITPVIKGFLSALAELDKDKLKGIADEFIQEKNAEFEYIASKQDELNKCDAQLEEKKAALEKANQAEQLELEAKAHADQIRADAYKEAGTIKDRAEKEAAKQADKIIQDAKEKGKQEAREEKKEEIARLDRLSQEFENKQNNQLLEFSQKRAEITEKSKELGDKWHALEMQEADNAAQLELVASAKMMKEKYQERMAAVLGEQQENVELKNQVKDQAAQIDGWQRTVELLQGAKTKLDNLSLEIHNQIKDDLSASDVVELINKLRNEKLQAEDELEKAQEQLSQANQTIEKVKDEKRVLQAEAKTREQNLAEEKQVLQRELNVREQRFVEVEANQRLVAVSQAVCRNLMEEMSNLKNSLAKYVGNPCKELSGIDNSQEEDERQYRPMEVLVPDLSTLVRYVQCYAANLPKAPLYYSEDDLCAFVAGLATSHLLILQGMSGTGKSSLPRVFAQSLNFHNGLIPVESSWRDRNDLLGYYNDFSNEFNTKPFTKELYWAAKQEALKKKEESCPRFITLDEMNLARIEYYFSDFLSILEEPDPDKRDIKLCAKPIRVLPRYDDKRQVPLSLRDQVLWKKYVAEQGDLSEEDKYRLWKICDQLDFNIGPKYLKDGFSIHIPTDLWFIGTANRDESTFAITDKVYDRAQVISLNERWSSSISRPDKFYYLTSAHLDKLFAEAKTKDARLENQVKEHLNAIDELLKEEFGLSFGHRIVTQAVDYVHVFHAAGGTADKALDYQISTKILRKVENSDNSEGLKLLKAKIESFSTNSDDYRKSLEILTRLLKGLA